MDITFEPFKKASYISPEEYMYQRARYSPYYREEDYQYERGKSEAAGKNYILQAYNTLSDTFGKGVSAEQFQKIQSQGSDVLKRLWGDSWSSEGFNKDLYSSFTTSDERIAYLQAKAAADYDAVSNAYKAIDKKLNDEIARRASKQVDTAIASGQEIADRDAAIEQAKQEIISGLRTNEQWASDLAEQSWSDSAWDKLLLGQDLPANLRKEFVQKTLLENIQAGQLGENWVQDFIDTAKEESIVFGKNLGTLSGNATSDAYFIYLKELADKQQLYENANGWDRFWSTTENMLYDMTAGFLFNTGAAIVKGFGGAIALATGSQEAVESYSEWASQWNAPTPDFLYSRIQYGEDTWSDILRTVDNIGQAVEITFMSAIPYVGPVLFAGVALDNWGTYVPAEGLNEGYWAEKGIGAYRDENGNIDYSKALGYTAVKFGAEWGLEQISNPFDGLFGAVSKPLNKVIGGKVSNKALAMLVNMSAEAAQECLQDAIGGTAQWAIYGDKEAAIEAYKGLGETALVSFFSAGISSGITTAVVNYKQKLQITESVKNKYGVELTGREAGLLKSAIDMGTEVATKAFGKEFADKLETLKEADIQFKSIEVTDEKSVKQYNKWAAAKMASLQALAAKMGYEHFADISKLVTKADVVAMSRAISVLTGYNAIETNAVLSAEQSAEKLAAAKLSDRINAVTKTIDTVQAALATEQDFAKRRDLQRQLNVMRDSVAALTKSATKQSDGTWVFNNTIASTAQAAKTTDDTRRIANQLHKLGITAGFFQPMGTTQVKVQVTNNGSVLINAEWAKTVSNEEVVKIVTEAHTNMVFNEVLTEDQRNGLRSLARRIDATKQPNIPVDSVQNREFKYDTETGALKPLNDIQYGGDAFDPVVDVINMLRNKTMRDAAWKTNKPLFKQIGALLKRFYKQEMRNVEGAPKLKELLDTNFIKSPAFVALVGDLVNAYDAQLLKEGRGQVKAAAVAEMAIKDSTRDKLALVTTNPTDIAYNVPVNLSMADSQAFKMQLVEDFLGNFGISVDTQTDFRKIIDITSYTGIVTVNGKQVDAREHVLSVLANYQVEKARSDGYWGNAGYYQTDPQTIIDNFASFMNEYLWTTYGVMINKITGRAFAVEEVQTFIDPAKLDRMILSGKQYFKLYDVMTFAGRSKYGRQALNTEILLTPTMRQAGFALGNIGGKYGIAVQQGDYLRNALLHEITHILSMYAGFAQSISTNYLKQILEKAYQKNAADVLKAHAKIFGYEYGTLQPNDVINSLAEAIYTGFESAELAAQGQHQSYGLENQLQAEYHWNESEALDGIYVSSETVTVRASGFLSFLDGITIDVGSFSYRDMRSFLHEQTQLGTAATSALQLANKNVQIIRDDKSKTNTLVYFNEDGIETTMPLHGIVSNPVKANIIFIDNADTIADALIKAQTRQAREEVLRKAFNANNTAKYATFVEAMYDLRDRLSANGYYTEADAIMQMLQTGNWTEFASPTFVKALQATKLEMFANFNTQEAYISQVNRILYENFGLEIATTEADMGKLISSAEVNNADVILAAANAILDADNNRRWRLGKDIRIPLKDKTVDKSLATKTLILEALPSKTQYGGYNTKTKEIRLSYQRVTSLQTAFAMLLNTNATLKPLLLPSVRKLAEITATISHEDTHSVQDFDYSSAGSDGAYADIVTQQSAAAIWELYPVFKDLLAMSVHDFNFPEESGDLTAIFRKKGRVLEPVNVFTDINEYEKLAKQDTMAAIRYIVPARLQSFLYYTNILESTANRNISDSMPEKAVYRALIDKYSLSTVADSQRGAYIVSWYGADNVRHQVSITRDILKHTVDTQLAMRIESDLDQNMTRIDTRTDFQKKLDNIEMVVRNMRDAGELTDETVTRVNYYARKGKTMPLSEIDRLISTGTFGSEKAVEAVRSAMSLEDVARTVAALKQETKQQAKETAKLTTAERRKEFKDIVLQGKSVEVKYPKWTQGAKLQTNKAAELVRNIYDAVATGLVPQDIFDYFPSEFMQIINTGKFNGKNATLADINYMLNTDMIASEDAKNVIVQCHPQFYKNKNIRTWTQAAQFINTGLLYALNLPAGKAYPTLQAAIDDGLKPFDTTPFERAAMIREMKDAKAAQEAEEAGLGINPLDKPKFTLYTQFNANVALPKNATQLITWVLSKDLDFTLQAYQWLNTSMSQQSGLSSSQSTQAKEGGLEVQTSYKDQEDSVDKSDKQAATEYTGTKGTLTGRIDTTDTETAALVSFNLEDAKDKDGKYTAASFKNYLSDKVKDIIASKLGIDGLQVFQDAIEDNAEAINKAFANENRDVAEWAYTQLDGVIARRRKIEEEKGTTAKHKILRDIQQELIDLSARIAKGDSAAQKRFAELQQIIVKSKDQLILLYGEQTYADLASLANTNGDIWTMKNRISSLLSKDKANTRDILTTAKAGETMITNILDLFNDISKVISANIAERAWLNSFWHHFNALLKDKLYKAMTPERRAKAKEELQNIIEARPASLRSGDSAEIALNKLSAVAASQEIKKGQDNTPVIPLTETSWEDIKKATEPAKREKPFKELTREELNEKNRKEFAKENPELAKVMTTEEIADTVKQKTELDLMTQEAEKRLRAERKEAKYKERLAKRKEERAAKKAAKEASNEAAKRIGKPVREVKENKQTAGRQKGKYKRGTDIVKTILAYNFRDTVNSRVQFMQYSTGTEAMLLNEKENADTFAVNASQWLADNQALITKVIESDKSAEAFLDYVESDPRLNEEEHINMMMLLFQVRLQSKNLKIVERASQLIRERLSTAGRTMSMWYHAGEGSNPIQALRVESMEFIAKKLKKNISDLTPKELEENGLSSITLQKLNDLAPKLQRLLSKYDRASAEELAAVQKQIAELMWPFLKHAETFNPLKKGLDADQRKEALSALYARFESWRYFAMLANPATLARNLAGNWVALGLDKLSRGVTSIINKFIKNDDGSALKYVAGKIDAETQTAIDSWWALPETEEYVGMLIGNSKYDADVSDASVLALKGEARKYFSFGNGKMSVFSSMSRIVYGLMDRTDRAFVIRDTRRIASQLMAANMSKEDIARISKAVEYATNLRAEMQEKSETTGADFEKAYAKALANSDYRTLLEQMNTYLEIALTHVAETYYKNTNKLNEMIRNLPPKAQQILKIFIPFPRMATNTIIAAYKYSPFSLIDGVRRLIKYNPEKVVLTQAQIDAGITLQQAKAQAALKHLEAQFDLGKGAVGTALWILGAILAAIGIVGIDDEDEYMGVTLKLGDLRLRLDQLTPASLPLLSGAAIISAAKNGNTMDAIDVICEASYINNFLSPLGDSNGGGLGSTVATAMQNYIYTYIPTLSKSLAKIIDPHQKAMQSNRTIGGAFARTFQKIAAGIPGLSYAVPNRIDPYTGDDRLTNSSNTAAAVFLNTVNSIAPVSLQWSRYSDIEKEAVKVGATTTGPAKSFIDPYTGDEIELNEREYREYQRVRAQIVNELVSTLIASAEYQNATPADKKRMLRNAYAKATAQAKQQFLTR